MQEIKIDEETDLVVDKDGDWHFSFDCDSQGYCQDLLIYKIEMETALEKLGYKK